MARKKPNKKRKIKRKEIKKTRRIKHSDAPVLLDKISTPIN